MCYRRSWALRQQGMRMPLSQIAASRPHQAAHRYLKIIP